MERIITYIRSISLRAAGIVFVAAAAALFIFFVGETVGYKKAAFSYRWSETYQRNFVDARKKMPHALRGRQWMNPHGAYGRIVALELPRMTVVGADEPEKIVRITDGAIIRKFRASISDGDLRVGDNVVAIGVPDNNGELEAKLIRVFPDAGKGKTIWRY